MPNDFVSKLSILDKPGKLTDDEFNKIKDHSLIGARIIAVADVYDAVVSNRPYRDGWVEDKAIVMITQETGKYFDPKAVDAFLAAILILRNVAYMLLLLRNNSENLKIWEKYSCMELLKL